MRFKVGRDSSEKGRRWIPWIGVTIVTLLVVGGGVLWYHGVDNTLTTEDLSYIQLYTPNLAPASPESSFDGEISFIKGVQDSVLSVAPANTGLPRGGEREPKDLYLARTGL